MKKTTQYMNLCRVSPKAYFKSVCSLLFTAYCLLICQLTSAQLFPVNVIPQLIPPYSLKLSDYQTTSSEKLIVNLLLTDTGEFGRQVRLKMSIEGQGLNIQTRDFVVGANPISLDGGVNQRLTNLDLRPYFRLNNLLGINPQQYNQPLPDGRYDFCFQVFDRFSGQVLSQKRCAFAYLVLNDPPFLNLPQRGEQIIARDPLNIVFRWTPRHLNAMGVRYEFTLKELWDTGIDPQAAFLASPILHQETTFAPTLLYGPANLPLLPDKTYGWRVRAISSTNGIDENAVYRNNGYSEIFHFRLTKDCKAPKFALSEVLGQDQVKIAWQGDAEHLKYKVQYRKVAYTQETDKQRQRREKRNKKRAERGKEAKPYTPKRINYTWFEVNTRNQGVQIGNLEAGQTYEFRVGGSCNAPTVYNPYYTYSDAREFTIPLVDETSSYQCGVLPEIYISNKKPLQNIGVNEVFTASDFPIVVTQVSGSNGSFSGLGYLTFPFLEQFKEVIDVANAVSGGEVNIGKFTRIKVEFNNIGINTDYQLISGMVKTVYDPNWKSILDLDETFNAIALTFEELLNTLSNLGIDSQTRENIDTLTNMLTEQASEELPEDLANRVQEAANQLSEAKKTYDDAIKSGDTAAAETAKEAFKEAQKELKDVQKEQDQFIKAYAKIIKNALKQIVRESKENLKKELKSSYGDFNVYDQSSEQSYDLTRTNFDQLDAVWQAEKNTPSEAEQQARFQYERWSALNYISANLQSEKDTEQLGSLLKNEGQKLGVYIYGRLQEETNKNELTNEVKEILIETITEKTVFSTALF